MAHSRPLPRPEVRCLVASILVTSAFSPALRGGQPGDSRGCLSKNPAAQFLKQAQDPRGSTDSRLAAYHKAVELCRKDPYLLYALVQEDRALGDREAGLKHFSALERDFPDSAWDHLLMGDVYADRHDSLGATREYRAAVAAQPSIPIAPFHLGRLAFDRGAYREAESEFQEELRLNPTFGDAHLYLGEALIRQAKNVEAVDQLKQAIALSPNSALAYQALATAQNASGRADAALATLREGQTRFPQD